MEFRKLKYIIAIAETGSISSAAKRLFIAQSSLSQFLKQYEEQLGCQLFLRGSQGLIPTDAGNVIIEAAQQVLKVYSDALQQILDAGNGPPRGKVTFGVSPFRSVYVLPEVLPVFHRRYPEIQVEIVERTSSDLEEMIAKSKIDIAFIAHPVNIDTNPRIHLLEEEIVIGCHRDHPLTKIAHEENGRGKWVDIAETLPFPYIMQASDLRVRKMIDPLFSACNAAPQILQYTQNMETAIRLAKLGYGLIFLPETYSLHIKDALECISIGKKGIFRKLSIIYPPHGYISRAASAFIEMIKAAITL